MEKDIETLTVARRVISTEMESLKRMSDRLNDSFGRAIFLIQERKGRVAIIGMGKSGIIGKKIAATLASTGTSAFFVHPGEAFHGDLGMIKPSDIAVLISNSGETEEIIRLIPFLQWQKNKTIALTGRLDSTLAKHADVVLDVSVEREACNNNLAPTSSTTATLVMGDALAVTLATLNDFQPEDFARFHPGGNLGRRLLTRVCDVMQAKNLPICTPEEDFRNIVHIMTNGRLGLALVMENDKLTGLITDGDLRRALDRHNNPMALKARDFMTTSPKTIFLDELFSVAEEKMRTEKIGALVVTDAEGKFAGVLNMYNK